MRLPRWLMSDPWTRGRSQMRRAAARRLTSQLPSRCPIELTWTGKSRRARVRRKARALATLARSRVAALVGPAGTGKTTMLKALCSDLVVAGTVLLLAPTGKARVQLGDKVGAKARTLAQFLRKAERW